MAELNTHGADFLEPCSAGHSLISHTIFNKLAAAVKKEFIYLLSKNYPTITEIFDNYHKILTTSRRNCSVKLRAFADTKPPSRFRESKVNKTQCKITNPPLLN